MPGVHQPGIVGKRRGNRRVVALRRQRIARGRAEDVDMGIAGPLRQAEAGKRPRRERRQTKGRDISRFSRHCRFADDGIRRRPEIAALVGLEDAFLEQARIAAPRKAAL